MFNQDVNVVEAISDAEQRSFNTQRQKNALSKHKHNFFCSSVTRGDDKEFFDRNFAGMNQQQVSRVKEKFL